MKKKSFYRTDLIYILIIIVIGFLLKIPFTLLGFFAFTYDQGRDFLEVAKIVYEHHLTLIGPTTGLPGVFYGPWWYYFLSLIFFTSKGSPMPVAIFFSILGVFTAVAVYIICKIITKKSFLSLAFGLIAVMSYFYLFTPTQIWNPTPVPILTVVYFFLIFKISTDPKPLYYLLLGLVGFLILDLSAAFGIALLISLFISPIFFKKEFFKKDFYLTLIGGLIMLIPRIIFDIRHHFLISKSALLYFSNPKLSESQSTITQRLVYRFDQFFGFFASFTRNNKFLAAILLLILSFILISLFRNKTLRKKVISDKFLKYLIFVLLVFFISFSIFKEAVWDYYLVGLPIIYTLIFTKIADFAQLNFKSKVIINMTLIILIILNFHKELFSPFKISWQGDGVSFRNQKSVMDYIASNKLENYSLYAYSPAIFDYPFDYLTYMYVKKGLLTKPTQGQNVMFLIIRDDPNHTYLTRGWYGDKTRDNTTVKERVNFPGSLIVEKHVKNE